MKRAENVVRRKDAENRRRRMKEIVAERNLSRRRVIDGDADWKCVRLIANGQIRSVAVAEKPSIEHHLVLSFAHHGSFQSVVGGT